VKKAVFVLIAALTLVSAAKADDLLFAPVQPCRIVDTRKFAAPWVRRYNGSATDIAVDSLRNVYVTGHADGDYNTIKYDTNGNQLWVKRYDGPSSREDLAYALAVDGSENVYVTGMSKPNDWDYATVKYDSDGNQLWDARYNGPGDYIDRAHAIALDASGNVHVTGFSDDGDPYAPDAYATIKYDKDGNQLWVARYICQGVYFPDMALDSLGNVYVTGRCDGNREDYVTVKYDSDGTQLWDSRYDGPASKGDTPRAIAVDGSGNVYVFGLSTDTDSSKDATTVKYDTDGNQLWVARYDSASLYGANMRLSTMVVDGSGNVYVAFSSEGGNTATTVKYDTDGNQLWVAHYRGPYNKNASPRSIAVDGSGNVYLAILDDDDIATVKYDSDGNQLWVAGYDGPAGQTQNYPCAMAVDSVGNAYVTGNSWDSGKYIGLVTLKYDTDLAGGPLSPFDIRSYNVYGAVASQGGNPTGCPSPQGEPFAVALNVTAVPMAQGNIVAYPFCSTAPTASLVNYKAGVQNIANSGTVKTCFNCTKDISIKSNFGTAHVVIDVLGYYFAKP
jgi:hypothetical protein